MYHTTRGLILREAKYKESDKILTILTETEGKITAKARGVARTRSKLAAATQLLVLLGADALRAQGLLDY